MTNISFKLLVGFATAYLAVLAILFVFQSRFIYPAPQTPASLTPGYQEVEIVTEDGLALRAFYQPAEQGMPTVLYFHGNGGTLSGASVSNRALVETGFGALLVEYRGYGGNPGSPSEAGLYKDGIAAARWLIERGVPPHETIVIGNSIGSAVATFVAADRDNGLEEPAALILIAPFMSLPDAAADSLWWIPARMLVKESYDTRARLAETQLRVLIQHGDADNIVGFRHGQTLYETAANAEFIPYAGSGHALSFEERSQAARRDWILGLDLGREAER